MIEIDAGRVQTVASADGTPISYQTLGQGPSIIVLPGALSVAADYAALANALAQHFTVHVMERRGRGLSGPQGRDYGIARECEDVHALQLATGASFLFGHSYGGLVALEAARNNPGFSHVAVYEPGVSINGSISMAWIPAYKKSLAENKPLDAFIAFALAMGPEGGEKTPYWLMRVIMFFVLRGQERRQMFELLPANLLEHQQVGSLDNTYKNYQQISAKTLLMHGGKSTEAAKQTSGLLKETLAQAEVKEFPGLDHFGPDKKAPHKIALAIREYCLA